VNKKSPLLSVICTTYNHEAYIEQTLNGFVSQKTTFDFEVIVHDDASKDKTRSIVTEYSKKFPDLFVTIFQTVNQFSRHDYTIDKLVFGTAKGKYIALCEGDDYWIDPLKLQKQVDFLERNEDYGLVYTKVKVFSQKEEKFLKNTYGSSIISIDDLLIFNYIPTPTVVFKSSYYKEYVNDINPYMKGWLMGDYPLWLYIASKSKIKFIADSYSVYRLLESSAAHSPDYRRELSFVESYVEIKLYFMYRLGYSHLEKTILTNCFISKARIYLFKNEKNISELIREIESCSIKSLKLSIIKFIISSWILRKMLKMYWLR
jgi:glycosyltransferase involved in cell wall biosynthesis